MIVVHDNFISPHGNFIDYTLGGSVVTYHGGEKTFDKSSPDTVTQWQLDGQKSVNPRLLQIGDMIRYRFSFDTYTPGSSWWQLGITFSTDEGLPNSLNGLFMNGNEFAINTGNGLFSIPTPPQGIKTNRVYTLVMILDTSSNMQCFMNGPGFNFNHVGQIDGPLVNRDAWSAFEMNSRDIFNFHDYLLVSNFGAI